MSPCEPLATARRRAFTLTELMVALGIGAIVFALSWNVAHLLMKGERLTDRDASRALAEARLMERLLQDMRSAVSVLQVAPGEYHIKRHITAGGRLATLELTWKLAGPNKVTREAPNEPVQSFDFSGFIDPGEPPFKFQLEKVPDVIFKP